MKSNKDTVEAALKRRISAYESRLIKLKTRLENVSKQNMSGKILEDLKNFKGWYLQSSSKNFELRIRLTTGYYTNLNEVISECQVMVVHHRYEGVTYITISNKDLYTLFGFASAYGINSIRNIIHDPRIEIKALKTELRELEESLKLYNDAERIFKTLLQGD